VFYQGICDRWFNGRLERFFAGEQGVFSTLAYATVVLWLWRRGDVRRAKDRLAS